MYEWFVGRFYLRIEPYQQLLSSLPPEAVNTHEARVESIIALENAETLGLTDVATMRGKFRTLDVLVERAFETFDRLDEPFEITKAGGRKDVVTQRWIIMAQITHEFHHKGQMLAYSRFLGYPLPEGMETDMVLP